MAFRTCGVLLVLLGTLPIAAQEEGLYGELERDLDRERGRVIPPAQYEIERIQAPRDLPAVLEIEEEQQRRQLLREQEQPEAADPARQPVPGGAAAIDQATPAVVAPIGPPSELEQHIAAAARSYAQQVAQAAETFAAIESPTPEQRRAFQDVLLDARRSFAAQVEALLVAASVPGDRQE